MQDKVTELGGTIIAPPFDVLDSGRMMTVQDPTGAFINLWQPKSHIGAGLVNTTGAMCWNELVTSDMEKAKAFYSGLFGWNISDDDYAMITNNGRMNGGIRQPSEAESQLPPHWLIYFTVADVEAAAETIKKTGGTLNGPLMDSGAGKTAYITDPAGARIALIQVETADPWEE
jgi:predicted enzyme related to lactoylglutathione lyase